LELLEEEDGRRSFPSCDASSWVATRESEGLDPANVELFLLSSKPVGMKSSKETVCGPLGANVLPCRCFGGGGLAFTVLLSPAKYVLGRSFSWLDSSLDERRLSDELSCWFPWYVSKID
jgi:hypothetical protein